MDDHCRATAELPSPLPAYSGRPCLLRRPSVAVSFLVSRPSVVRYLMFRQSNIPYYLRHPCRWTIGNPLRLQASPRSSVQGIHKAISSAHCPHARNTCPTLEQLFLLRPQILAIAKADLHVGGVLMASCHPLPYKRGYTCALFLLTVDRHKIDWIFLQMSAKHKRRQPLFLYIHISLLPSIIIDVFTFPSFPCVASSPFLLFGTLLSFTMQRYDGAVVLQAPVPCLLVFLRGSLPFFTAHKKRYSTNKNQGCLLLRQSRPRHLSSMLKGQ